MSWNAPPRKVKALCRSSVRMARFEESSCSGLQLKMGDKLLLRLNSDGRPIANKYCEGKMKRTLKRELTDLKLLRRKL